MHTPVTSQRPLPHGRAGMGDLPQWQAFLLGMIVSYWLL